jgi:dTDP-4-dehydrorhamnose reductase
MKILLFGVNGQVGWELNRSLQPLGEVIALDRSEADFSRPDSLRSIVAQSAPDVIVNATAYTAVDAAEDDVDGAVSVNTDSVKVLAEQALSAGALLIHYSTDYVFDGSLERPYTEDDMPSPINVYGRTKLEGERVVAESGCDYIIMRTSWVFAARGKNFVRTILKLARERDSISIVDDQVGAPTWARSIADITAHVIRSTDSAGDGNFHEIYHLTSDGSCSWYDFAKKIIELARNYEDLKVAVHSITSDEYPFKARRPANSLLSTARLREVFGVSVLSWDKALELCMEEVYQEGKLKP